jgi:hypothetical protein
MTNCNNYKKSGHWAKNCLVLMKRSWKIKVIKRKRLLKTKVINKLKSQRLKTTPKEPKNYSYHHQQFGYQRVGGFLFGRQWGWLVCRFNN